MPRGLVITALVVLCLALVAGSVWLVASGAYDRLGSQEVILPFLEGIGPWAAVVLLGTQVTQVLVPFIPGQLLGMAAGYLYGTVGGTLLSSVGIGIGSWIAILLARRYGRPFVERHAQPETIARIDALAERYGSWAFFLVALIPVLPTDVGCFVAGLTPLRTRTLLLPIALGRMPGILILSFFGATSKEISLQTMLLITAGTLCLGGLMIHYRDRLEAATHALLNRARLP